MTLTNIENFLSTLDPSIAKQYRTAADTTTEFFPVASKRLTRAMGGGIARKRLITIHGNESAGKSALMQQSIGQWQKQGLTVAYFDTEAAWDAKWAARLGVDNDNLILVQNKSIAGVADQARPFLEAEIDILIVDSISQAVPEVFLDEKTRQINDFKDLKQIGAHAKSITILCNALHYSNKSTAMVLISQTTTDLSGMHPAQIPHGGKKIKFASSQIVKVASSNALNQQIMGDIQIGNKTVSVPVGREVTGLVDKNKVDAPFARFSYNFMYRGDFVGIDSVGETVDDAIDLGIIDSKPKSAWLEYGGEKWQGRANMIKAARADEGLLRELDEAVEEAFNGNSK